MIKITLVDDHHIVREGVKNLIETNANYKIIEEYDNAEGFLHNSKLSESELLITDISLPGMSGIELTRELRKKLYTSKIIVLSMHDDQGHVKEAFDSGANGYLLKDCSKDELFKALTDVLSGERYVSNSVMKSISTSVLNEKLTSKPLPELSEREKEIIKLLANGIKSGDIAKKLCLSPKTISNHRANIMYKLDVKNASELIAKAIKAKII